MAIIKCPECGHEVSDAADRCPNCGVSIAGNIKSCPDCGRVVLRNAEACPSCGAKLSVNQATPNRKAQSAANSREQYSNIDPYAPDGGGKKKSNKGIIIGISVAVVVIALGALAYVLIGNAQKERAEQETYEEVIVSNDTSLYNQYLESYPEGKHADEVKAKLGELVAEINDWRDACVNNTKGSFVAFLGNHKNSPFEQACKDKIDSLDFEDALNANTAEALQLYISNHPDGKYIEQATQTQNNLAALKVQPDEAARVKAICSQFFAAIEAREENSLTAVVAPVMDNFLNKRNATHSDVVAFANKLVASKTQIAFTMNNDYKIHKVPTDTGEYSYEVTFSVDETSGADMQDNLSTYYVSTHINPQMLISSLNMRKVSSESGE